MNENPYSAKDKPRLDTQRGRIRDLMLSEGAFYTLKEIAALTGDPEASISAQLRHLTKPENGGYIKVRIHKEEGSGTWYYQLLEPNDKLFTEAQLRGTGAAKEINF